MGRINSENHTGVMLKDACHLLSEYAYQRALLKPLSKQVIGVEGGSVRTAISMARLTRGSSTLTNLHASVRSKHGQAFAAGVRAIVGGTCEHVQVCTAKPTSTARMADHVQLQAAHAKSVVTPSLDRKIHSHVAMSVMSAPSAGNLFQDDEAVPFLEVNKKYDWLIGIDAAGSVGVFRKEHSFETGIEKTKRLIDITLDCFATVGIFHADSKRDEEFVQIIEEFASHVRISEADQNEINNFVRVFAFDCNATKRSLESGENKEKITQDFEKYARSMVGKHASLFVSLGIQCKLVSELKASGFDMMDRFRRSVIERSVDI